MPIPAVGTCVWLPYGTCPQWDPPSSRVVADQDLQKGQSGESQGSAVKVLLSAPALRPCRPPPPEAEPQPFPGLVSCCLGDNPAASRGESHRPISELGHGGGEGLRGHRSQGCWLRVAGRTLPGGSPGLGPEADLCVGRRASPLSRQRGEARLPVKSQPLTAGPQFRKTTWPAPRQVTQDVLCRCPGSLLRGSGYSSASRGPSGWASCWG